MTLFNKDIKDSPYTVVVSPGEVKSSICTTTIPGTPINSIAGITYFFTIQLVDVYGNLLKNSPISETRIDVVARYQDHNSWLSPIAIPDAQNWQSIYGTDIAGLAVDNKDGTYTAQVTVYKAGKFIIDVKVNSIHVTGSPFDPLLISPSNLYGPACEPKGIPTTMVAGVAYSYQLQSRDFFQNNMKQTLGDLTAGNYLIRYNLRPRH